MIEAAKKNGLQIYAYELMTNHIYMLATPQFENSVSKVFQSLGASMCNILIILIKKSGTLWEERYRATIVDRERYLLKVMRFIELNTV